MPSRNQSARLTSFLAICVLSAGLATHAAAQDDDGHDNGHDDGHDNGSDKCESITGIVDQLQLIDSTSMGGGRKLIIHLETGEAFRLPHADHVAAGSGVKVRIRYREASGEDDLPVACNAEVLALPLEDNALGGEPGDSLRRASQPFEVYRNLDCEF
ncbi:MAG: hypothetical protein WD397_01120 [Wenzhouxiangellaceae bacterium]